MIGDTLGHYRIESQLGEGGMGVVYRARDTHLDRPVAIKVLRRETTSDPERKRRFVQEAKSASALNHRAIVTIYDIDIATVQGHPVDFIAMEFIEGKTLDKLIGSHGLPLDKAFDYAIQVADGLSKAHGAGIIHRDLKPANIIVTGDGRVKVVDFGLAKLTEVVEGDESGEAAAEGPTAIGQTRQGTILGTAAYMSPEQAEGKRIDSRSDIFSFGVILYEMVTGRRPFSGDSIIAVMSAVLHQEPVPLDRVSRRAPPELTRIVSRCLRKSAERRFHHMVDLKVALMELRDDLAAGKPAAAGLDTSPPPRRPWAWMVAGSVIALAGIGAGIWFSGGRAPAEQPVMRRLTFDSGLTFEPVLSPDGSLVAYASDRSGDGNLDIWVQQVNSGAATRLTRHASDDREPVFSPDGSRIAFRSERDGGGIYVVPAIGGEEKLLARQGRRPRFSPDGKWIAYWVGAAVGVDNFSPSGCEVFVVSATGGAPQRLKGAVLFSRSPVWSPDSRSLLFMGSRESTITGLDWWVAPIDGGAAVATGVYATFGRLGFLEGFFAVSVIPDYWLADRVVFSARRGDTTSLWQLPFSSQTMKATGAPQRFTSGIGMEMYPAEASPSGGGRRLVFASLNVNTHVWGLPIQVEDGKPAGEIRQLTTNADDRQPSITVDGKTLVYASNRTGNTDLWLKDLASGKETALTSTPLDENSPKITLDGSRVAYEVTVNRKRALYVIAGSQGVPEKVCEDCGILWGWSADGRRLLYMVEGSLSVGSVELASPGPKEFLKHPRFGLAQVHYSPDDRWIVSLGLSGPGAMRVQIVAAGKLTPAEGEWIAVTEGSTFDDKPRWSPGGTLIYFTTDLDGFRCIWARKVDAATKRPVGSAFPVYHSHGARRSLLNTGILPLELGVARDKLVFNLSEVTGNIWMAEMAPSR